MTEIEKAIIILEMHRGLLADINFDGQNAFLLAIEALREKAEREKGCKYCTIDSSTRKVLGYDGSNDGIGISYSEEMAVICADSWEITVHLCPVCGRKLKGAEK